VIDVNIILGCEKLKQKAEATIHISGKDGSSSARREPVAPRSNALVDKLDRQVLKHKEKVADRPPWTLTGKHEAVELITMAALPPIFNSRYHEPDQ